MVDGAQDAEGGALTVDGLNVTFSSSVVLSDRGGMILNGDVLTGAKASAACVLPLLALCASGGGRNDTADGFNCSCVATASAASGAAMGPAA